MSVQTRVIVVGALVVLVGVGAYALLSGDDGARRPSGPPPEEEARKVADVMENSWAFYASRKPFERPQKYSPVPKGLPDMKAETCGACHQEIYREWAVSTHRRAWLDDAQFQKELAKSRGEHAKPGENPGDVGWLCINCHTPMMNQLDRLVVGLEDGDIGRPIYEQNPALDVSFQNEAITCATCHVKDGVIHGPYGDGSLAPHPVVKDESLLQETVCTQCHQAEQQYEDRVLGCFFDTGKQWEESAYAQNEETCQSCHMPVVDRKVSEVFDGPVRRTRRHWFGGSLIPKRPEFEAEVAPLRKVFGSGVTFEVRVSEEKESCSGCVKLVVRVTNDRAGHHVPTGDPERHVDVEARVLAPDGKELGSASFRFGSKFEWWPKIKRLTDTRLPAGQHKDIALEVPANAPQGSYVEVKASKWRMYQDGFDYHELEGEYVRGRTFHRSRWALEGDGVKLVEVEDDRGRRKTLKP